MTYSFVVAQFHVSYAVLGLWLSAAGLLGGGLQAVFSDLTGDGAARAAFGAFFAISYGVGSLWVAVIGWIISAAGFPVAFAVMAASFAAAAMVIGLAARGEPSPPTREG